MKNKSLQLFIHTSLEAIKTLVSMESRLIQYEIEIQFGICITFKSLINENVLLLRYMHDLVWIFVWIDHKFAAFEILYLYHIDYSYSYKNKTIKNCFTIDIEQLNAC